MKYLKCSCCSFLAVIPEKDSHDIICPFCYKMKCEHELDKNVFEIITKEEFLADCE